MKGWKLVPVERIREMCLAARRARSEYPIEENPDSPVVTYRAMAPQPPVLGRELEPIGKIFDEKYNSVMFYRQTGDTTKRYHPRGTEFVALDTAQAHVARLQAELARSNAAHEAAAQHQGELNTQIYRLQAEVERLKTDSKTLAELDDSTIKRLGDRLRVSDARTAELEGLLRDLRARGDMPRVYINWIDSALSEKKSSVKVMALQNKGTGDWHVCSLSDRVWSGVNDLWFKNKYLAEKWAIANGYELAEGAKS